MKPNPDRLNVKLKDIIIYTGFPKYRCLAEVMQVFPDGSLMLMGKDNKGATFIIKRTVEWEPYKKT